VQSLESIKIFMDGKNFGHVKKKIEQHIERIYDNVSELNIIFPKQAINTKGIISIVSGHLAFNGINVLEFLSSTPELIIYLESKDMLKAYATIQRLKQN
jgi:hypothetical protein